jgi:hypothetical protein
MKILLSTTGTQNTVNIRDLDGLTIAHPTTNFDLLGQFELDVIFRSLDLQYAIDNNYVTILDDDGRTVVDVGVDLAPVAEIKLDDEGGGANDRPLFHAYDADGLIEVGDNWVDIQYDTEVKEDDNYSHVVDSAEVIFDVAGWYEITADVTLDEKDGSSRTEWASRIVKDTGSGYSVIDGSYRLGYSRNSSQGGNSTSATILFQAQANDKIKVQAQVVSGGSTLETVPNGCSIFVAESTARGAKGDKGDTGSGSTIAIEEDDTQIEDQCSTLNFEGNVDVVDEGGGKVTINVTNGDGANVFGTEYAYASSETLSSTTSTSYQQKLRLSVTGVPEGEYHVGWSFEWRVSNNSHEMKVRVQLDDADDLGRVELSCNQANKTQPASGFKKVSLNGDHDIDLDYCATHASHAASIGRARLGLWRVG